MKYNTIEINGKEINFRLTSADCVAIEEKVKKNLQDYVTEISVTNAINLLMYMRRAEVPNFSKQDAMSLYDELVDNDYSLESIYMKVIFPTCVDSGLLTKSDLERIETFIAEQRQATE